MSKMYFDERDTLRANLSKLGERDRVFAASLLSRRYLTDKQKPYVAQLIQRATEPQKDRSVQLGDGFGRIVELFDKALASRLKFPKMLVTIGDRDYRLSVAGERASAPGSINVCDTRRSDERQWFGRVTRDGKFEPSRKITDDTATAIGAALQALAHDPAQVASAYGQRTGVCCFCGLELTDGRSVHVGYGPVCAEKWSLPWGDKPEPKAKKRKPPEESFLSEDETRGHRVAAAPSAAVAPDPPDESVKSRRNPIRCPY